MNEMQEQRIGNLLGMAQRARRVVSGSFAAEQALKEGSAKLVLLAEDAEEQSRKNFEELAEKYEIPCRTVMTREKLGACMGKEYRAVAAVLDEGFGKSLLRLIGN